MSQIGSNAAGEVFADFKLNTSQLDEALKAAEAKAASAGANVERAIGEPSGKGVAALGTKVNTLGTSLGALAGQAGAAGGALGGMASAAGPAGAAVAAMVTAVLALEKGIREFNNAAADYSKALRDVNDDAGDLASNVAKATSGFDDLERAARSFGEKQIRDLQDQIEARSLYAQVSDEIKRELGGQSIEEAKINQYLTQREQILALVAKRREDVERTNMEAAATKRAGDEQLRTANELAKLEKEVQDARRAGLTEQERQAEALRDRIAEIKSLADAASNSQTKAAFEAYAEAFAKRLKEVMKPVMDDAAEKFVASVQAKFAGVFDNASLTDGFGTLGGKLDAISSQLQNRGAL